MALSSSMATGKLQRSTSENPKFANGFSYQDVPDVIS